MKKLNYLLIVFLICFLSLIGCSSSGNTGNQDNNEAERIYLTYGNDKVYVGDILEPTIVFYPEQSYYGNLQFTSSNLEIAIVNEKGIVSVLKEGIFQIKVVCSSFQFGVIKGESPIYDATSRIDHLTSLSIKYPRYTLMETISMNPKIEFEPKSAALGIIDFSSSNSSIASVDADGVVLGISSGKVTITMTSNYLGFITTFTSNEITVVKLAVIATSIQINPVESLSLEFTHQVSLTLNPINTTYSTLKFESLTPSVALIDDNGVITPVAEGNFIYRVTSIVNSNISAQSSPIRISRQDILNGRNMLKNSKEIVNLLEEYRSTKDTTSNIDGFSDSLLENIGSYISYPADGFLYRGQTIDDIKAILVNLYNQYHLEYMSKVELEIPYVTSEISSYGLDSIIYTTNYDFVFESRMIITPKIEYSSLYPKVIVKEHYGFFKFEEEAYNAVRLDGKETELDFFVSQRIDEIQNSRVIKTVGSNSLVNYESDDTYFDIILPGDSYSFKVVFSTNGNEAYDRLLIFPGTGSSIWTVYATSNNLNGLSTNYVDFIKYKSLDELILLEQVELGQELNYSLLKSDIYNDGRDEFSVNHSTSSYTLYSAITNSSSQSFITIANENSSYYLINNFTLPTSLNSLVSLFYSTSSLLEYTTSEPDFLYYYFDYEESLELINSILPNSEIGLLKLFVPGGTIYQGDDIYQLQVVAFFNNSYFVIPNTSTKNVNYIADTEDALINLTDAAGEYSSLTIDETMLLLPKAYNNVGNIENLNGYYHEYLNRTARYMATYPFDGKYIFVANEIIANNLAPMGNFLEGTDEQIEMIFGDFLTEYKIEHPTLSYVGMVSGSDFILLVDMPAQEDFILLYQFENVQSLSKPKDALFYDERGMENYKNLNCYSGAISDGRLVAILGEKIQFELRVVIKAVKTIYTLDYSEMQLIDMSKKDINLIFGEKGAYFSPGTNDFQVYYQDTFYFICPDYLDGRGIILEDSASSELTLDEARLILDGFGVEFDPETQKAFYWYNDSTHQVFIAQIQITPIYSELFYDNLFVSSMDILLAMGDVDIANEESILDFGPPYYTYLIEYPSITFVIVSNPGYGYDGHLYWEFRGNYSYLFGIVS